MPCACGREDRVGEAATSGVKYGFPVVKGVWWPWECAVLTCPQQCGNLCCPCFHQTNSCGVTEGGGCGVPSAVMMFLIPCFPPYV